MHVVKIRFNPCEVEVAASSYMSVGHGRLKLPPPLLVTGTSSRTSLESVECVPSKPVASQDEKIKTCCMS
jgi:hypothetical protein